MAGLLSKEHIIAPADYNRWRVPVASVAIHLCIGSVYAWSIYNPPLTRIHGVVTSAGDDWSLSAVVWVPSLAIPYSYARKYYYGRGAIGSTWEPSGSTRPTHKNNIGDPWQEDKSDIGKSHIPSWGNGC